MTRAEAQAETTAQAIARRGGTALCLPCLELQPITRQIDAALAALRASRDAAVLITSRNGVTSLLQRCSEEELRALLAGRPLFAVGRHTASALERIGISNAVVPERFSQLGVADHWAQHGWPQALILIRAEEGRDDLPPLLTRHRCRWQSFDCYRNRVPTQPTPEEILRKLEQGAIDAVLLGSAATARGFVQRVGLGRAHRPVAVAISERVAKEAEKAGLRVQVVAGMASFDAMLDALARHFTGGSTA